MLQIKTDVQVEIETIPSANSDSLAVQVTPVSSPTFTPDTNGIPPAASEATHLSVLSAIPAAILHSHQAPPSYESQVTSECIPVDVSALRSPPAYGSERRCVPERLFWLGFAFPLIWVYGALYTYLRSDPFKSASSGKPNDDAKDIASISLSQLETGSYVEEVKATWRAQERFWAALCLRAALVFFLLLGTMLFIMLHTGVIQV